MTLRITLNDLCIGLLSAAGIGLTLVLSIACWHALGPAFDHAMNAHQQMMLRH